MLDSELCDNATRIHTDGSPVLSVVMFLAGAVGNLTALAILALRQRDRHTKASVFRILVTGLVLTDLLGTSVLSPPVFLMYTRGASLVGLGRGSRWLCNLFAFAMAFFSLSSTLILSAMALERCIAIGHPYFYSRHARRSSAKATLALTYLLSSSVCLLPLLGTGRFRQYCPGTWCFISMEARGDDEEEEWVLPFSLAYCSLMMALIAGVCVCNGSVVLSLRRMRPGLAALPRRQKKVAACFGQGEEEVDHLVLLGCMTVIFIICSLPLTICGFVSAVSPGGNDQKYLVALRFSALNPILDPWVFILFRKAVFHKPWLLFRRCLFRGRTIASPTRPWSTSHRPGQGSASSTLQASLVK